MKRKILSLSLVFFAVICLGAGIEEIKNISRNSYVIYEAGDTGENILCYSGKTGEKYSSEYLCHSDVRQFSGRQGLEIDGGRFEYGTIGAYLQLNSRLMDFTRAYINVDVNVPSQLLSDSLYLRIEDAQGEIFRFKQGLNMRNKIGGWQTVEFFLRDDIPQGSPESNGVQGNGRIDMPCYLLGVGVDDLTDRKGTISIGKVNFRVETAPIQLFFVCGEDIMEPVIFPYQKDYLKFVIPNFSGRDFNGMLNWKSVDANGVVISHGKEILNIPEKKVWFKQITGLDKFGVYTYQYEISSNTDLHRVNDSASFVLMPRVIPSNSRKFGVAINPYVAPCSEYDQEDWENTARLMTSIGLNSVKINAEWENIQPSPKKYSLETIESLTAVMGKHRLPTVLAITSTPVWAVDNSVPEQKTGNGQARRMPELDFWNNLLNKLASGKSHNISGVEVWNNPDLFSAANFSSDNYLRLLKATKAAMSNCGRDVKIYSGAMVMPGEEKVGSPDLMAKVCASGSCDVVNINGRGTLADLERRLRIASKVEKNGGVLMVTGANGSSAVDGKMGQANLLFKKAVVSIAGGASGFYWQTWHDPLSTSVGGYHGLVTVENDIKPSLVAFGTFISLLGDANFHAETNLEQCLTRCYTFHRGDGATSIVAWSEDDGVVPLVVKNIENPPVVYDIYGNQEKLEVSRGTVVFDVTKSPRVIIIPSQSQAPEIAGGLMQPTGKGTIIPGAVSNLKFGFVNPMKERGQMYNLNINLPAGLSPSGELPKFVVLDANDSKTISFPVIADDDFISNEYSRKYIDIEIVNGEGWRYALHYPVEDIVMVKSEYSDTADFRLDSSKDARSMTHHDNVVYCNGDYDSSAKIWLRYKNGRLQVKVQVRDDDHTYTSTDSNVTDSGDMVIVGLKLPGDSVPWILSLEDYAGRAAGYKVISAPVPASKINRNSGIRVSVEPTDRVDVVEYVLDFPEELVKGLSKKIIGFNVKIVDNDGRGPKSFRTLSGGLEWNELDASQFLPLMMP